MAQRQQPRPFSHQHRHTGPLTVMLNNVIPDLIRDLFLRGIAGRARNDEPLTVMLNPSPSCRT